MYYVSFLHLEVGHRHPVLLVFCDILLDTLPKHRNIKMTCYGTVTNRDVTGYSDTMEQSLEETQGGIHVETRAPLAREVGFVKSKRLARNRWLKAYTLLRNPGIRTRDPEEEFEILSRQTNVNSVTVVRT